MIGLMNMWMLYSGGVRFCFGWYFVKWEIIVMVVVMIIMFDIEFFILKGWDL